MTERTLEDILKSANNPNIKVTIRGENSESQQIKKEIADLTKKIEKLEEEHEMIIFKRDEKNRIVRKYAQYAKEEKEQRDICNKNTAKLQQKKKELFERRDQLKEQKEQLLTTKHQKGDELNEATDKQLKHQHYIEFQEIRDKIGATIQESKDVSLQLRETSNDLRESRAQGQDHHVNMLAYYAMRNQEKKEADAIHKEGRKVYDQIKKLKSQRYKLYRTKSPRRQKGSAHENNRH